MSELNSCAVARVCDLEHVPAKWRPVGRENVLKNNQLERRPDSIGSKYALSRAARVAALAVAVLAAGCASSKGPAQQSPYAQIGGPQHAAVAKAHPRVEVEDDGLPVQTAPRWRTKTEPDDPNEPFSPNYGRASPVPARAHAAQPARMSSVEADALVARAIAAHEIRRQ
jgi:hypothetical protein